MMPLVTTLIANGLPLIANTIIEMLSSEGEKAAKKFIKDKTGLDLTGNEQSLDKNQLSTLATAEEELAIEAEENRHQESIFKLELDDVRDAREMGEKYSDSDDKFLSRFVPIVSIIIIIVGFGYITAVTFLPIPEANKGYVSATIEFVKVIVTMTASYWLGTSYSSSRKDSTIKKNSESLIRKRNSISKDDLDLF